MADMYIAAIASLGGKDAVAEDREPILAMFERTVTLRKNAYPIPHTQMEADTCAHQKAQGRSQVVQEIGFDPSE